MTTQPDKCREAFEKWFEQMQGEKPNDKLESTLVSWSSWASAWNAATVQPMEGHRQDLLDDMRCQAVYSDKVTMPVPLYERIKAALQCRALLRAAQYAVDDQEYIGTVRIETMRDLKSALEWAEKQRMSYELRGGGYDEVIYLDDLIRAATVQQTDGQKREAFDAACRLGNVLARKLSCEGYSKVRADWGTVICALEAARKAPAVPSEVVDYLEQSAKESREKYNNQHPDSQSAYYHDGRLEVCEAVLALLGKKD